MGTEWSSHRDRPGRFAVGRILAGIIATLFVILATIGDPDTSADTSPDPLTYTTTNEGDSTP